MTFSYNGIPNSVSREHSHCWDEEGHFVKLHSKVNLPSVSRSAAYQIRFGNEESSSPLKWRMTTTPHFKLRQEEKERTPTKVEAERKKRRINEWMRGGRMERKEICLQNVPLPYFVNLWYAHDVRLKSLCIEIKSVHACPSSFLKNITLAFESPFLVVSPQLQQSIEDVRVRSEKRWEDAESRFYGPKIAVWEV